MTILSYYLQEGFENDAKGKSFQLTAWCIVILLCVILLFYYQNMMKGQKDQKTTRISDTKKDRELQLVECPLAQHLPFPPLAYQPSEVRKPSQSVP